jgi:hypothetical protein
MLTVTRVTTADVGEDKKLKEQPLPARKPMCETAKAWMVLATRQFGPLLCDKPGEEICHWLEPQVSRKRVEGDLVHANSP